MQKSVKNPNFRTALVFSSERSANSLPTCADGSTTLVLAMRNKLESLSIKTLAVAIQQTVSVV